MNLKSIYLLSFWGLIVFITSSGIGPSSSGAPPSHTGAPNESSCAASGCHDDNAINSGSAKVGIFINGTTSIAYEPGKTYELKVRIADADVGRFGYQVVALTAGQQNAGSLQIINPETTQLERNFYKLSDRQYVTYTFNGTGATEPGIREWAVSWTAPDTDVGDVIFYTGAVAANDDETDKGDHVYLANLKIHAKRN